MLYAEVLIFACVCAMVKGAGTGRVTARPGGPLGSSTREYVKSLDVLRRNTKVLLRNLPYEDLVVTDPRRHYIIITGVLACVVEYLNSDCTPPDYDHEFLPAVDRLLPIVWQDPRVAVEKLQNFMKDANATVNKVQLLVDRYCHDLTDAVCDQVIEAITSGSYRYDDALNLLILLGELGELYEEHEMFVHVAENFQELELLLKGRETLKPLVLKAAEVYNKLYGQHCEP